MFYYAIMTTKIHRPYELVDSVENQTDLGLHNAARNLRCNDWGNLVENQFAKNKENEINSNKNIIIVLK